MPCALPIRSEEHTSELQSHDNLVCRLLLEKKKTRVPDRCAPPPAHRRPRAARRAVPLRRRACVPARAPAGRLQRRPARDFIFFFNDTATTEIYTLSLHDALPISDIAPDQCRAQDTPGRRRRRRHVGDRKSTRLNSSHTIISYAVFCLKNNNRSFAPHLARPPRHNLRAATSHPPPH